MSNDPDWYDRLPRWAQDVIDQSLHLGIGLGAASVLWIGQPIAAGVFAAAFAAALREWEQWPPKRWGDLALDVVVTILGGLAMGLAIWRWT